MGTMLPVARRGGLGETKFASRQMLVYEKLFEISLKVL